MQLYLDSYGAFLGVRNKMFYLRPRHSDEHVFAVHTIDVIIFTKGITMTSDALMLALENEIPVVFIDAIGHPVGQVWGGRFGSIATIRRHQVYFADKPEGWFWMADFLKQKIENQRFVIQNVTFLLDAKAQRRQGRAFSGFEHAIQSFTDWKPMEPLKTDEIAATFRAWEAVASRFYFRFLASIMPAAFQFENRNFRPALDRFNCLLNYLYGMLYVHVELALMKSGIDPTLGILHVDRHNRPTMAFDFIEPFRYWADLVALQLIFSGTLPADGFLNLEDEGGFWLGAEAKPLVISAMTDFLNQKVLYQKGLQKRHVVIDLKAQKLATQLKNLKV
jgi:CRISP-associated protein Cas1